MKRLFLFALFALIVGLFQVAKADSGWVIRSFDSQVAIETTGHITVTETIEADFGDIEKHGIYRDIPIEYKMSDGSTIYTQLSDISVRQDGNIAVTNVSKNYSYWSIRIGEEDKTITGRHTYKVRYKMLGALRNFGELDELTWDVTGNDWEIPIEKVTATVTLPSGKIIQSACYEGFAGSTDRCSATLTNNDQASTFATTRNLAASEGMTVSVGYPAGLAPIVTIPRPPTVFEQATHPASFIGFGIVLIGGLWMVINRYLKVGRDAGGDRVSQTIVAEYEPPANLRPGELGVLVDEEADTLDITATIIDLASRGFLTIKEEPKKWLFGQTDYILTKAVAKTDKLLPYESRLYNALFAGRDSVSLSSLKNSFYTEMNEIKDSLYKTIMQSKLFTADPQAVRTSYYVQGFLGFIFGFIGTVMSILFFPALALLAIALGIVGVVTIITGKAMPARTAEGRELYRQALGYKLFINTAEKYRARFAENENLFNEILPYAIVFGATKKFAQAMKDMGLQPASPTWYVGTHPFSPVAFASEVDTFSHSISTAMVSSPSSSGGGGSSGGGFGGGGGGSW